MSSIIADDTQSNVITLAAVPAEEIAFKFKEITAGHYAMRGFGGDKCDYFPQIKTGKEFPV